MSSRQTLSVCMIVRDEEQHLPDCLASIKDLADQLIIVDTGSTDHTVEIAGDYGAEVHSFTWCNDFAAARNASISYASGDWILWLDADECLQTDSVETLRKLLVAERQPVIYKVQIRNLQADGQHYSLSDAHRLFTNHRGIQFSGAIHEQISPSAREVGAEERTSQVFLDHFGYALTGKAKQSKQDRNRKLLEAEVRRHPKSAYLHLTLGHNYKEAEELQQAEQHYRRALELKQLEPRMEASLLNALADTELGLQRWEEAESHIRRSRQITTRQFAVYYLQYRLEVSRGHLPEAVDALQTLLARNESLAGRATDISTDIQIEEHIIQRTLGDLYARQEDWSRAAEAYEAYLALQVGDTALLKNYFRVLEKLQNWERAVEIVLAIIQQEGEQPKLLQALATLLIRLEQFPAALDIYLRLNDLQPHNTATRKMIAGLYAKTGQLEASLKWLQPESKA